MSKRHHVGLPWQRMRDVPNVEVDDEFELGPEASLAEDAIDALGPDFRHRVIREMAEGGRGDGADEDDHELNDGLHAEAEVAHLRQNPWR